MSKKRPPPKPRAATRASAPETPVEGQLIVIGRVTGEMRDFGVGVVSRTVNRDVLEKNLDVFIKAMGQILGKIQGQLENYQLDSISLKAEVSASGSVSLLGTGGTVQGGGGLEFTFKRIGS
jgi:hypothetical protein